MDMGYYNLYQHAHNSYKKFMSLSDVGITLEIIGFLIALYVTRHVMMMIIFFFIYSQKENVVNITTFSGIS